MKNLLLCCLVFTALQTPLYAKSPIQFQDHIKQNTTLDLSEQEINDKDIPAILTFLDSHPEINTLDLSNNEITAVGVVNLAKNSKVANLDLHHEQKCHNANYHFCADGKGAAALANNVHLKQLDLSQDAIGDKGAIALAKSNSITHLKLAANDLHDAGVIALAKNKHLIALDLFYNKVSLPAVKALANNTHLETLVLRQNNIGDAAAVVLAKNTTLSVLDVSDCNIGAVGAKALAGNTTLKKLNLNTNAVAVAANSAKHTMLVSLQ